MYPHHLPVWDHFCASVWRSLREGSNALLSAGADIIMALDDVVSSVNTSPKRYCSLHCVPLFSIAWTLNSHAGTQCGSQGYGSWDCRFEEATHRTTRWIDRCIKAHARPHEQNLFAIVQGGLDEHLRAKSIRDMSERDLPGYAVGGLAGGESKEDFWRYNICWECTCTHLLVARDFLHAELVTSMFLFGQGGGSVHGSWFWPASKQAPVCHGCWVSSGHRYLFRQAFSHIHD